MSFVCLEPIFVKASLVSEVGKVGSSEPMIFATFQAFEVFRLLTILQFFDDLDEFTTVSSALPLFQRTPSVPSSLGAKSDDPVVFNNEISGAAIYLKPWIECQ